MEISQTILILLAGSACGLLALYMAKGIVDIFTGKMRG